MSLVQKVVARNGNGLLLALILLAGLLLRCYHLGYQSLWLDEIYTAIESDPAIREEGLLHCLRYVDQQPPLFFLLEQVSVWLFGNSEASLRLIPALAGNDDEDPVKHEDPNMFIHNIIIAPGN